MFHGCNDITEIDLSKFDTSLVTDMSTMFCDCGSLSSLNLSNFNTSLVTNMWGMFQNCYSLASLNLSSFDGRSGKFRFAKNFATFRFGFTTFRKS